MLSSFISSKLDILIFLDDELNLSIACAFSLSVELSLMKIAVRFVVNPVNELEPYFCYNLSTSDFIEFSNVF